MAQPDWLDRAASHGSTKWLKEFLRSLLPQLQDQVISPQDFALALDGELEGRRLMSPERQKNYRSNVCQALKELDAHHPAIALVSPTTDQYRQMNDAQRGKLAERETRFFTSDQAEALVGRATGLLGSREWSEVAAGLAVLIGRRISEILLSGFEVRSPWSLTFTSLSKKVGAAAELSIEIPTLAPAAVVLGAIERLQRILEIEDLKAASLSPKMAKQKVNGRFSEAVASQCHSHFADLVPARTDRETLYTHLFRAVYATIAAHWFCPPTVPEHLFKAEIQGHFTLSQEGRKLPNYSARANYDDYAIGTEEGNRDGRLGIKLGQLPGLQVMEAFRKSEVKSEVQQDQEQGELMDMTTLSEGTRNALYSRASNLVLASTWSEMGIGLEVLTGVRAEVLHGEEVEAISTYGLRVDGEGVESLVQQLQPTITRFKALQPDADEAGLQEVVDRAFGDLVKLHRDDLPQVYGAILQARRQRGQEAGETMVSQAGETTFKSPLGGDPIEIAVVDAQTREATNSGSLGGDPGGLKAAEVQSGEVTNPSPVGGDPGGLKGLEKGKFKRPAIRVMDLDRLGVLMVRRGVRGSVAELFEALLDAVEAGEGQQEQPQTVEGLASSLVWFTGRVDRLEGEVQRLQQECERLMAVESVSQEGEALRLENHRLERELHQYRAAVEALQSLPGQPEEGGTVQVRGTEAIELAGSGARATPVRAGSREGQAKPLRAERATGAKRGETEGKISSVIDALIQWNAAQADAQRRLRISIPVIRPLASLLKASNQQAIQAVLEQRKEVVEGQHDRFGITPRHNAAVRDVHGILKLIAKEMGLENWEQVRKPG